MVLSEPSGFLQSICVCVREREDVFDAYSKECVLGPLCKCCISQTLVLGCVLCIIKTNTNYIFSSLGLGGCYLLSEIRSRLALKSGPSKTDLFSR